MRKFLNSTVGQVTTALVVLAGIVALIWSTKSNMGSEAVDLSRDRMYIDATTGKPYHFDAKPGEGTSLPLKSPSGVSGYPAEPCYWNADGSIKSTPTYVLLKAYLGEKGPTFCPDCGRLVVPHNPAPSTGMRPPPTQKDYERMRQNTQLQ